MGGLEQDVNLFDLMTGKIIRTFVGHSDWAWTIALSFDGKFLASTGPDRTARLWDTATGRELAVIRAHDSEMSKVAFTPDGRQLITGDQQIIKLWDLNKLLQPRVITTPGQCTVEELAFSADGKWLATGEVNRGTLCSPLAHINIWEIDTGKQKLQVNEQVGFSGLKFIPNHSLLVASEYTGVAAIWDLTTNLKKVDFLGHARPSNPGEAIKPEEVHSLAVAPNGQFIATGDIRKTVKVWTPDGKEITTIRGPGKINEKLVQGVFALDFSPDCLTSIRISL